MEILTHRPRRLRKNKAIRDLTSETYLSVKDLIYPLFIKQGNNIKIAIKSMPGIFQYSQDLLIEECKKIYDLGISGVLLFGIPDKKDNVGSEAYNDNGIIQNAVRVLKKEVPGLLVITDLCFCEYTNHGHCGIYENSDLDNDKTLELVYKTAISQARAGSDIIAPSLMVDGMVGTIRAALNEQGFSTTPILSYSAKYNSSFYGPFREAANSSPMHGDRKTYQMDIRNSTEALKEVALDIEEGADIVMVKPAISYLDIISRIKENFDIPVAAYSVSGEYSMIKAASQNAWLDEKKVVLESTYAIKRAGANFIITYFAKDLAQYLEDK